MAAAIEPAMKRYFIDLFGARHQFENKLAEYVRSAGGHGQRLVFDEAVGERVQLRGPVEGDDGYRSENK